MRPAGDTGDEADLAAHDGRDEPDEGGNSMSDEGGNPVNVRPSDAIRRHQTQSEGVTNPVRSQCVETTRVGPAAIAAGGRLGAARLGRWGGGAVKGGGLCTVALLLALCADVV